MRLHTRMLAFTLLASATCILPACSEATGDGDDLGLLVPEPGAPEKDDGPRSTPLDLRMTELELRTDMRKLWLDHVTWTRVYLISAIAGLPDTRAAAARLLHNQDDLGDAIKPFYGKAAGAALTGLLRDHITIAVQVVSAAKAGDRAAFATANAEWNDNADDIAVFLSVANPNWLFADLKEMMHMHLDQTLAEATARLTDDWSADTTAYDAIVTHILTMADVLSHGIAVQFPERFAPATMTVEDEGVHDAMRQLWGDHVAWTRFFLMSAIANLPDAYPAAIRLYKNQTDIGDAIKPFYGDAAGNALRNLLYDHITIAVDIVVAAKAGDADALATAKRRWGVNADEIAGFLARANPTLRFAELQHMMHVHLNQTLAEATARLTGDWAADVRAYDAAATHILGMADMLSDGLAQQFPQRPN